MSVCVHALFYVFLRFSESLTRVRVRARGFGCVQVFSERQVSPLGLVNCLVSVYTCKSVDLFL